jgi:transcriptional regulator with XRE-family HTH domain
MDIKDRIVEFLKTENISSANFAQEIGVQPSGISHIYSGRNKPSLDFIVKMLNRYPYLSTEWLLFGKGNMTKENIPGDISDKSPASGTSLSHSADLFDVTGAAEFASLSGESTGVEKEIRPEPDLPGRNRKTSRVLIFYDDNTFREFFPG